MKHAALFIILSFLGIIPFPAHAQDFSEPKLVDFETFEKAMLHSSNTFSNGINCSFSANAKGAGIILVIESDRGYEKLVVSKNSEIYEQKSSKAATEFIITGIGSVKMIHAADAYESVSITNNQTKNTASCEIDY